MRGRVVVNSDNIITYTDSYLTSRIGDICTRNGASVCILGDGTPADPELGLSMLATCRRLGHITSGDYWIVGPRGTIYVERVELSRIVDDNRELFVGILEYEIGGASPLALPASGGMVGGLFRSPAMPTEQPAVLQGDKLTRELAAWELAMPGEGFKAEQIRKRIASARYLLRAIGVSCYTDLDSQRIAQWMSAQIKDGTLRKKTARTYLSLLASWGECLVEQGLIQVAPRVKAPRGSDAPMPGQRPFTPEEQVKIIAAAMADEAKDKPTHKDLRSFAYRLLSISGGRRRETSKIRVCDLSLDEYPPTVTFLGKNGRVDTVPLTPDVAEAAREWLNRLQPFSPTDPIFPPHPHPMKFPADRVLETDMAVAGVPRVDKGQRSARWGSFRKGLASALVEAGVEQSLAQKILRHRTTEMTMNVYAKVRSSKLLEQVMRTGLAEKSTPDEKNISETTASGADLRYTHEASPSRDPMTHPTHISGRDEGTHPLKAAEDWLSHVVIGCAFPRVPSCGADAGGSIRPGSVDSDPSAMPRGGLEPPCTGDSARLGADAVGLYYTDQIPVTTPSGRDNTRGNRVASTSPLSEAGPAARESGAAFDVVRSQDAAPHGTAALAGGGVFDSLSDRAGSAGASPSGGPVPPSYNDESTPATFDHDDAALAVVASVTATAQSPHLNRSSPLMRMKTLAAAAAILAAAVAAPTVGKFIDNGWKCAQANGCLGQPTPAKCILCCFSWCSATTQQENECQQACLGAPEPIAGSTYLVREMARVRTVIDAGQATQDELIDAAGLMVALAGASDDHVAQTAVVMSDGLPWAGEAAKAYAARPPHNEQGVKTTGTRKRTA